MFLIFLFVHTFDEKFEDFDEGSKEYESFQ
jgi:hypothetical protein